MSRQPLPVENRPHVPKSAQAHKPRFSNSKFSLNPFYYPRRANGQQPPRFRNSGPGEGDIERLLEFLDAADARGDGWLGFEGEDASGRGSAAVETEAEDGVVGGELGGGAVEEDVFLDVGLGVEGGEETEEGLVGGGVW